jgi:hypothetical protein
MLSNASQRSCRCSIAEMVCPANLRMCFPGNPRMVAQGSLRGPKDTSEGSRWYITCKYGRGIRTNLNLSVPILVRKKGRNSVGIILHAIQTTCRCFSINSRSAHTMASLARFQLGTHYIAGDRFLLLRGRSYRAQHSATGTQCMTVPIVHI